MKVGDRKYICENKKWRIDTKYYFGDGTYKRLSKKWFNSKAEAIEYYNEWEKRIVAEHDLSGDQMFVDFLDQWNEYRLTQIRGTTAFTSDKSLVGCFILPYCEKKTVNEAFDQTNIIKLYNGIKSHDCSTQRKNSAIVLLHNMVDYAYNLLMIGDRVHQLAIVRTPKLKNEAKPKEEIENRKPWNAEEQSKFLEAAGIGSKNEVMFRLFLKFAMRIGEFLALKPSDIDLDRGIVRVSHQIVYQGRERPIDTTILKSTNSYREFPMGKSETEAIREWIEAFGTLSNEYLFKANGTRNVPVSKTQFRRDWKKACDKAGIRYMVPHGARHIKAYELLSKCENLQEQTLVSQMLGHTPSVDLNTYANHADMDKARELLSK